MAFRFLALVIVVATLWSGCASDEPGPVRPWIIESRLVAGEAHDVLAVCADAVRSLGYRPFLGNPEMVVGSQSDATVLTPFAFVGGLTLTPFFIATWPLADGPADSAAWWPLIPLAPWANSFNEHEMYVWVSHWPGGRCTVTAKALGDEPRRSQEIEPLWAFLGTRRDVVGEVPPEVSSGEHHNASSP